MYNLTKSNELMEEVISQSAVVIVTELSVATVLQSNNSEEKCTLKIEEIGEDYC